MKLYLKFSGHYLKMNEKNKNRTKIIHLAITVSGKPHLRELSKKSIRKITLTDVRQKLILIHTSLVEYGGLIPPPTKYF